MGDRMGIDLPAEPELSFGDGNLTGVFSKSASVPSSVSSSRHRTEFFFLTGVKETPLRATPALRRRGDGFTGDARACCCTAETAVSAGAATGLACTLIDFFRFGVPRLVGGNSSTGIIEPSGLTTCDAAE